MENTKDLNNPFIRDGHDSPLLELDTDGLLNELQLAFACYIAWDWGDEEFDEAKAQKAYKKIKEIISVA